MMILYLEAVELEQYLAVRDDLVVVVAPVTALRAEHPLIEATGRGDVANDHHRLRPGLGHGSSVGISETVSSRPSVVRLRGNKIHERRRR
jgi:hypothetical protein